MSRDRSVLVVVDVQEPFLNVMHNSESLLTQVRLLVRSAGILGVPVIVTTQNVARLGGTVPAIAEELPMGTESIDKMCFSCAASDDFRHVLTKTGRRQVILCGVETHICISQTAADLIAMDYSVHVSPDAVTSRTQERHKLGMERIRDHGILPISAEAAVYEWLETANAPEFKRILPLVK
ncbi:MAG: isochorismatase family protein [Bacteroidia bacterium]|nr:isochorismatase family protein [Bacteroidia bacterium]